MPKHWQKTLGEQIRVARLERKLSQEELAQRVNSNRGSIIQYEAGTGNPEFRVIAKIASELEAQFTVLSCRVDGRKVETSAEDQRVKQLELMFDQDHSFLANVTIHPTRKSITITAHSDYGIKSA